MELDARPCAQYDTCRTPTKAGPRTGGRPCLRPATEIERMIIGPSTQTWLSVPSLFRLTLISTTKRREPTLNEIPAQRHSRRYHHRHQKLELYTAGHGVPSAMSSGPGAA